MTIFVDLKELSVFAGNSIRSIFSLKNFNHCFEVTFNPGCNGFHIGFSPFKNEREFVSYMSPSTFIEKTKNGDQYNTANSISIKQGNTIMTCLNSNKSLIYSIANGIRETYTFTHISKSKTWYAFIDAQSLCAKNPSKLSVNFGKTSFVNTMPDGYKPMIIEYYSKFAKRYCTNSHTKTNHPAIPLILLIIFSS